MYTGVDYAGGRPHPDAIIAAGHKFVVRYLTSGGPGLPGKLLLPDEYRALVATGIAIVANFETSADRMKYGAIAGAQDARVAQAAIEGIGMPHDQVVYLSADWDAQPHEYNQIDAYLTAAGLILGAERVGVYGSYSVVKHCLDVGTARWAWQTGAWSRGRRESRAHIYQRIGTEIVGGVACDVNEALAANFGQHPRVGGSSSMEEEDDMQNWMVTGKGRRVIICPTGSASASNRRSWFSAAVPELTGDGWVRVFAQNSKGGVNDWTWGRDVLSAGQDNLVRRSVVEVADGTTHLVVLWDLTSAPDGGTFCLETKV